MKKNNDLESFGIMLDCSRNGIINFDSFKKFVDIISKLGYNEIQLYTEDTYEVDNEPYFGYLRSGFSKEDIKQMDAYANSKKVLLVPCIQTLAHLGNIFRHKEYEQINDISDIIMVGDERTYTLLDNIFKTISECFSSKKINIGMDEAFLLGKGKYMDKNGFCSRNEIITYHLHKVLDIASKYNFKCEMWGDMFMRSAYGDIYNHTKDDSDIVKKTIPDNLDLIYWDYYHEDEKDYLDNIEKYQKLSKNIVFAGGAWTWTGFCPNNSFAINSIEKSFMACKKNNIKNIFITLWGDNGAECSYFSSLPALFFASEFVKGNNDLGKIKQKFKDVIGISYDSFCLLDLPNKIYSQGKLNTCNISKVMFYSDLFKGIYDYHIDGTLEKKYYDNLSNKLSMVNNRQWGYIFKVIKSLCDVLKIKAGLGKSTREIYKSGDKEKLKTLANNDYLELIKKLKVFYNSYLFYWNKEKKFGGFDVQDARLGGLIQRVSHCRKMLLDYCNNKISSIPELEENILPLIDDEIAKTINYNNYNMIYTNNVI